MTSVTDFNNLRSRVKALEQRLGDDFINDTVEAYEALSQRVKALEGKNGRPGEGNSIKPMRIRVNASRTAKGYSVEATLENTELVEHEWAERLQAQALDCLASVMGKLDAQYPRDG